MGSTPLLRAGPMGIARRLRKKGSTVLEEKARERFNYAVYVKM